MLPLPVPPERREWVREDGHRRVHVPPCDDAMLLIPAMITFSIFSKSRVLLCSTHSTLVHDFRCGLTLNFYAFVHRSGCIANEANLILVLAVAMILWLRLVCFMTNFVIFPSPLRSDYGSIFNVKSSPQADVRSFLNNWPLWAVRKTQGTEAIGVEGHDEGRGGRRCSECWLYRCSGQHRFRAS